MTCGSQQARNDTWFTARKTDTSRPTGPAVPGVRGAVHARPTASRRGRRPSVRTLRRPPGRIVIGTCEYGAATLLPARASPASVAALPARRSASKAATTASAASAKTAISAVIPAERQGRVVAGFAAPRKPRSQELECAEQGESADGVFDVAEWEGHGFVGFALGTKQCRTRHVDVVQQQAAMARWAQRVECRHVLQRHALRVARHQQCAVALAAILL